jgi:uncharacterized FlaG/YvyC family protein
MASDDHPVQIPAVSLVHGSQAPTTSGKPLPAAGRGTAGAAPERPAATAQPIARTGAQDLEAQVALLNKYLNDSGRPAQFRVDPNSDSKLIQEVNPATGEVIGEYPAISFPALARSLGISGAVINRHA